MSNYFHPLTITGSKENKELFAKELEKIGYKLVSYCTNGEYICVNSVGTILNHGEWGYMIDPNEKRIFLNIDNKWEMEAALALAEAKNITEKGSWVTLLKGFNSFSKGSVMKITGINSDLHSRNYKGWIVYTPEEGRQVGFRWEGNGYYLDKDFRISTAEEIIQFFKNKHKTTSKMEAKRLIGYKLRDEKFKMAAASTLNIPSFDNTDGTFISRPNYIEKARELQILDLWFEPVYEIKKTHIPLAIGSNETVINVHKDGYISGRIKAKIEEVIKLRNELIDITRDMSIAGHTISIPTGIRCIRVGCSDENHLVSLEDMDRVIKAYNDLQ